jgi:rhodanese-related sulfurtransferase
MLMVSGCFTVAAARSTYNNGFRIDGACRRFAGSCPCESRTTSGRDPAEPQRGALHALYTLGMKFLIDNIFLVLIAVASGTMLIWPMARRGFGSASVSPAQATLLINRQDAVVFDVRDTGDYANGRILHARNVPLAQIDARLADLAKFKDRAVILCDENGAKSQQALGAFRKRGFNNLVALAGGLSGWRQAGLPTEK